MNRFWKNMRAWGIIAAFVVTGFSDTHAQGNVSELSGINGLDTDGTNFWLVGELAGRYKLYKASESGQILGSTEIPYNTATQQLQAVAYQGGFVYVTVFPSGPIIRVDPSTYTRTTTSFTVRSFSFDMTFLGTELWQTHDNNDIKRFDVYDQSGHEFPGPVSRRKSITSDGTFLYIGDAGNQKIYRVRAPSGEVTATYDVPFSDQPRRLCFKDGWIWSHTNNSFLRLLQPTLTFPSPPSGLTATPLSPTSVLLKWKDDSSNETDYRVWWRLSGQSNWPNVKTGLPANTDTFTVTGLNPDTTYEFTVAAHNAEGNSNNNPIVSAKTQRVGPTNINELSSINGLDTDGTNFWLTGVYQETYRLYKASESGTILGTCEIPYNTTTQQLQAVAYQGGFVYVAVFPSGPIYRIDPSTCARTTTSFIVRSFSFDMTFCGTELWQTRDNNDLNRFEVYDQSGHEFLGPVNRRQSIACDGTYLYIGDVGNQKIYKVTTSGTVVDTGIVIAPPKGQPNRLCYKNAMLWSHTTIKPISLTPLEVQWGVGVQVFAGRERGSPGSTVAIPISVSDAKGIAGGDMTLTHHNADVLTAKQVKAEALLSSNGITVVPNLTTPGQVKVSMAGPSGITSGSGALVTITFEIKATAKEGIYPLTLQAVLRNERGDTISSTAIPGSIRVVVCSVLGDVNDDKQADSGDAILVLRHSAGLIKLPSPKCGDVNCDGNIDSGDAILILRYSAGLIKVFPCLSASKPAWEQRNRGAGEQTNVRLDEVRVIPQKGIEVPMVLDAGVSGGDLRLSYDPSVYGTVQVKPPEGVLIATNLAKPGEVRLSVARMEASEPVVVWIAFTPARGPHPASPSLGAPILRLTGQAFGADGRPLGTVESVLDRPAASSLSIAYPNPFNPSTTIRYALAEEGEVQLTIYSASGQVVRRLVSGWQAAGRYSAMWDGKDDAGRPVASGVYIGRLEAGTFSQAQKMVLVK